MDNNNNNNNNNGNENQYQDTPPDPHTDAPTSTTEDFSDVLKRIGINPDSLPRFDLLETMPPEQLREALGAIHLAHAATVAGSMHCDYHHDSISGHWDGQNQAHFDYAPSHLDHLKGSHHDTHSDAHGDLHADSRYQDTHNDIEHDDHLDKGGTHSDHHGDFHSDSHVDGKYAEHEDYTSRDHGDRWAINNTSHNDYHQDHGDSGPHYVDVT